MKCTLTRAEYEDLYLRTSSYPAVSVHTFGVNLKTRCHRLFDVGCDNRDGAPSHVSSHPSQRAYRRDWRQDHAARPRVWL